MLRKVIHEAKPDAHCLIALVGSLRSCDSCNKFIADGVCGVVSLSRPFICESDLVKRWEAKPHYTSQCVSCLACHALIKKNEGFYCPVRRNHEKAKEKH